MKAMTQYKKQQGAALIVGLILMVVITILAISGMNTATTELAMARNDQNFENAFQAAETGLEQVLAQGSYDPAGSSLTLSVSTHETVTADMIYEGTTHVPDQAFSLGVGTGIKAHHFLATSQAESRRAPGSDTDRDSFATHSQAFYIVGPPPPSIGN